MSKNRGSDESEYESLELSLWTLRFKDPALEALCCEHITASNVCSDLQFICAMLLMYVAAVHFSIGNVDSSGDRAAVVVYMICSSVYMLFLSNETAAHNLALVSFVCFTPATVATIFLDGDTLQDPSHVKSMQVIVSFIHMFVPMLAFNSSLFQRLLSTVMSLVLAFATNALRSQYFPDDGDDGDNLSRDVLRMIMYVVSITYISEAHVRRGFVASRKVVRALRSSGEYMQITRGALDVMLPRFVSRRLLSDASVITRLLSSDVATHQDVTWTYDRASVAFVSFHVSHDTYERVQPMLNKMEHIASQYANVRKVKTVNTTMLLVAGIDKTVCEDLSVSCPALLDAVIEIVRFVFAAEDDCVFTAGIHTGSCLGAVVGLHGLTFDVFGDTINTASRMQTTAPHGTIQLSGHSIGHLLGEEEGQGLHT
eukprot:PhM_4_TR10039/c2_g2_i1/m.38706